MSIIAAGTSSGTALVSTGDTNGTLVIQTNGTTVAATFGTDQSLTVVGALTIGSAAQAVPSGSAPLFAARAWVNFNGTGTVAIRASGNVSSITDNGTGDYTVNFTTAISDVNYCSLITINTGAAGGNQMVVGELSASIGSNPTLKSTTQLRVQASTTSPTLANIDPTSVNVAIFR